MLALLAPLYVAGYLGEGIYYGVGGYAFFAGSVGALGVTVSEMPIGPSGGFAIPWWRYLLLMGLVFISWESVTLFRRAAGHPARSRRTRFLRWGLLSMATWFAAMSLGAGEGWASWFLLTATATATSTCLVLWRWPSWGSLARAWVVGALLAGISFWVWTHYETDTSRTRSSRPAADALAPDGLDNNELKLTGGGVSWSVRMARGPA